MVDSWASTPRLDPPYAVRRLAELTGVELAVKGLCRGGEDGAAYVRWHDGRRSVPTGGTPTVAPPVELARAAGLPVARYELAALEDLLEDRDRPLPLLLPELHGVLVGPAVPLKDVTSVPPSTVVGRTTTGASVSIMATPSPSR